jgi:ABC-type glycerol-3-phosphate transport system substrate-binding protein
MRKHLLWAVTAVILFGVIITSGLFAGSPKKDTGKMEGQITARLWFWGEDEAPGLTDFLQHVGDLYTERIDPKVAWEITHLDIDQIYTGFYAAVEAKDAPELHTLWGGVLGLEPAWAGLLAPISDYVSEDTLSKIHPVHRHDGYWNGKDWLIPLYLNPWPLMINKKVWRDSGLDPDNLPTTWDGFMAAVRKIKASGYTPWCVGIKDGFYGTWFPSILQFQLYDSPADYHRAIIGDERLDQPPHSNRWYQVQDLYDNGAFNPDVNSLSLAEGQDLFLAGDVAIIHASGNAYMNFLADELGEENLALWIPPVDSRAKMAGKTPVATQPVVIPKVAKYKEEAGKFLEFFYTKEIQNEMYKTVSVFSGSTELDRSLMKNSLDRAIYDFALEPGLCYVWQHPGALEEESYAISQKLLAGETDASGAARQFEQTARTWRKDNPEMVKNFEIWATEEMPFMK